MSLARVYMAFSPSTRASPVVNRTQSFLCAMSPKLHDDQQMQVWLPVTNSGDVGPGSGPETRAALSSWAVRHGRASANGWITELDLSPVIARADDAVAVDARVRIQPAQPADAYVRQLR